MAAPAASAAWRIQIFAARGHTSSPPPAATRNAKRRCGFGAARAINYTAEDFVAVVKAGDRRQRRGRDPGHGRRRLCPAQHRSRRRSGAASSTSPIRRACKAEVNFAPVLTKRLTLAGDHLARPQPRQKQRHPRRSGARGLAAAWRRADQAGDGPGFPLAEAQKAHEFMAETGHIGKILLDSLKVFALGRGPR